VTRRLAIAGALLGALGCAHPGPSPRSAQSEPKRSETEQIIQLEDVPYYERRDARMGTEVQILVLTTDDGRAGRAADAALAEISRIEAMMTDWNETSPLMEINHAAGLHPVRVDRELLDLLEVSKRVSDLTEGAFDVTFAAAGKLWDFKSPTPKLPDPRDIERALAKVDWRKLAIDFERGTAFLEAEGMRIGLGGIAKGYAVDRAADVIRKHGFEDFAIKAGGDMRVAGLWNEKPWKIGIRDPRDRAGTVAVLPVSNVAISTAGDYERFFDLDGKRYGHIIDPKTGYPVDHTWSVTIIARDCTLSDGLDDGVFVLGAERGMALVESLPEVEAVIIDGKGEMHVSRGLAKR
jgi:FAD:protein FMN transferase